MSLTGQTPDASTSAPFSKDRLRDALDGIIARRFFAGWNKIGTLDPEIVVNGVGRIHLPLLEEQARQIISKAQRAPFDKGSSETTIDTAVQHNAWELDPQGFTITAQSQWDNMLKEFLKIISRTLGISNRIVRADLHKLSIWEKGAVFKAHADTEKIPHMFGTLVISLPSHYRGGDIIVRYLDEEAAFSAYDHDMAGVYWYSDASHESLPIEFGYRWVLTYNLIANVSISKPLEGSEIGSELLRNIMELWTSVDCSDNTKPLYYTLDNKHTRANLSLANLNSRDQAFVEQLLLVCHDLDFHFFLASLQLEDVRQMDDEPGNQYPSLYFEDDPNTFGFCIDSTLKAEYVNDLDGNEVLSSITIDEDSMMHSNPFGESPDDEMDDEEVTTYFYRSSALVIVPPMALGSLLTSHGSDFLSYKSDPNPIMILNYCIDRCQSSNSKSALDVLLQLLEKTRETGQLDWTAYTALAEKLYKLAMTRHGSELIDWIAHCALPLPLTVLGWLRGQFETFAISFERLNIGFSSVIQTRESLNDKYQVILAFRADPGPRDQLLELINDTPTKTIGDGDWGFRRSYEDGFALYHLALCAQNGLEVMNSAIIPKLVRTCGKNTEFMLGFLHGWHQGMQRKEMVLTNSTSIYENLVRVTVQNMSIHSLAVGDEEAHDNKRTRNNCNSRPPKTPLASYKMLYRFVVSLFQPYLEEQRDTFIKTTTAKAKSINAINFENLWIPLLQNLLSDSEELKISLFDQSWQRLYQTVLESFLLAYVGKLPKPDLVRKPVSCSCNECSELNQFLLDPAQIARSFNMRNPSQMSHSLQMFLETRNDCTHYGDRHDNNITITKVDPKTEREGYSREKRKIKAAEYLRAFDPEKLRRVLAGRYDAIITMSFLEHPEDTATINSSASLSMQRRMPLVPLSTNLTASIPPLEGRKTFPGHNMPLPLQAKSITSPYDLPTAHMFPIQPINGGAATMQAQIPPSLQTIMPSTRRPDLSTTHSAAPQLEAMRNRVSSAPYTSTWQEVGNSSMALPSTAATRSVSNPSRPLPSTMIRHPVAGAKRRMVELIDLTSEDD